MPAFGEDDPIAKARQFFTQTSTPPGLLVPLYHYPANVHTNAEFNRIIDLKKAHPKVPVCVIVNPASGPGEGALDQNYVKAIDRLTGAGIVTLAYVSTEYGKRTDDAVRKDILAWRKRYPRTLGIFFDEMAYSPDNKTAFPKRYAESTQFGHEHGYWPIFANPGTDTPQAFFDAKSADVFVVHEGKEWPEEARLKGDYFGGYADYPPHTRAVLIHSSKEFDRDKFRMMTKYVRWLYVTDDVYANPQDNPWDTLSAHAEAMFEELEK